MKNNSSRILILFLTFFSALTALRCRPQTGEYTQEEQEGGDDNLAETPYKLKEIYNYLASSYPQYENITYGKPTENKISSHKWFLPTPNLWKKIKNEDEYNKIFNGNINQKYEVPNCTENTHCIFPASCQHPPFSEGESLCLTAAYDFPTAMYNALISAEKYIDIVTLNDVSGLPTNGAFSIILKNALHKLAKDGKKIEIRIISGIYTPYCSMIDTDLLDTVPASFMSEEKKQTIKKTVQNACDSLSSPDKFQNLKEYLTFLVSDLPAKNNLKIKIMNERSCNGFEKDCDMNAIGLQIMARSPLGVPSSYLDLSWNHAKFITIDNYTVITGGENYWGVDYLQKSPVNDMSMEVSGSIASGSTIYANKLWKHSAEHPSIPFALAAFYTNICYVYEPNTYGINTIYPKDEFKRFVLNDKYTMPGVFVKKNSASVPMWHAENSLNLSPIVECQSEFPISYVPSYASQVPNSPEHVYGMFISKLNYGIEKSDADQSEATRIFAFKNAKHSIKISQQALYVKDDFLGGSNEILEPLKINNENIIDSMVKALQNEVHIYIVTSGYNGNGYGSNVPASYIYQQFEEKLKQVNLPQDKIEFILSQYLHVAYVSYNTQEEAIKNHSKFWMVDDELFYIGSHNMYAFSLQEFGVIIDDRNAAHEILNVFWNPMWETSFKASETTHSNFYKFSKFIKYKFLKIIGYFK